MINSSSNIEVMYTYIKLYVINARIITIHFNYYNNVLKYKIIIIYILNIIYNYM